MELLSLGSINADFMIRVDDPDASDEPQHARDFLRASGGKAANVALFASRLGVRAALLGRVGDDDLASLVLAPLRESAVDVGSVRCGRGQTGVAMIRVAPSGNKRSFSVGGANLGFDDDDIVAIERRIEAADAPAVLVVDWEIPRDVVARAIGVAWRRGLTVIADPSFASWVDTGVMRATCRC